jgi:isopentenyl diphosphate isomerase/L-lactate dehydrogenase-like FMN-dependent dehydrogenase
MAMDEFSRRRFLTFLAGSPLFMAAGIDHKSLQRLLSGTARDQSEAFGLIDEVTRAPHEMSQAAQQPRLIGAPGEALDIFDFEPVAKGKVPPAHWGYLITGTDDDATIKANRDGYSKWALRPRRLVDISKLDTSVDLLGRKYDTPIILCPLGSQKAFHAEGELAVARAAKAKNHLQVLSTVASTSIEDVIAARGAPVWFQLYTTPDWNQTRGMIKRAEAAGAPAVVFTVDLLGGSNRETMFREAVNDTRDCIRCHAGGRPAPGISGRVDDRDNRRKPALAVPVPGTPIPEVGTPTWDYVKRIKDTTSMKVFVKGLVTSEDAELAIQHGASGMFVSNHGGRADNSLRATVECLPEITKAVHGRAIVELDGGIRRGTDIFKALALGATAVGIGRPYIWGLASFGQEGVEAVLAILRKELEIVMKQSGTTSLKQITQAYVVPRNG